MRKNAPTAVVWQPPKITVTRISIRTTAASHSTHGVVPIEDACLSPAGHPLGVAAGAADTPAAALEEMRKHARDVAVDHVNRLIRRHRSRAELAVRAGQQPPTYDDDFYYFINDDGRYVAGSFELSCEVIGVHMSGGQAVGGRPTWIAYGTVVALNEDPTR